LNALLAWAGRAYREVRRRIETHRPFNLAAEIAFYFLLASHPLAIMSTAALAYLPVRETTANVAHFFERAIPGEGGARLAAIVLDATSRPRPHLVSIALLALLWTASSGMVAAIEATEIVREADNRRPWWRKRLVAAALTIGLVAIGLVGVALVSGVVEAMGRLTGRSSLASPWERRAEVGLGLFLLTAAVELVFHFGPESRPGRYRIVSPGALVAVLAGLAASEGLSIYVHRIRDLNAIYGSLGASVLVVLWFYVLGIALVLGAEVNSVLDGFRGRRPAKVAAALPERVEARPA
jgi:membrane protein